MSKSGSSAHPQVPLSSQKLGGYWRVPAIGLAAALVAFVISLVFPTEYPAVSRLLIRTGETSYSATDSNTSLGAGVNIGGIDITKQQTLGATLTNLVTARESVQEIVRRLGVDRINGGEKPSRGFLDNLVSFFKVGVGRTPTANEAAIEKVQSALEVVVLDDSWIMEITAWDPDPAFAKLLADTAADVSVEQSEARFKENTKRELDYLTKQLETDRAAVAQKAKAVADFKSAKGIVTEAEGSSVSLTPSLTSSLDTFSNNLVGLRAKQKLLQARLEAATGTPEYETIRALLTQTESDILVAEAQFNDVANKLGGASPTAVNDTQLQLASLQTDLSMAQAAFKVTSDRYTVVSATLNKPRFDTSRLGQASVASSPGRPLRYLFLLVGLLVGGLAGLLMTWFRSIRENDEREEWEQLTGGTILPGAAETAPTVIDLSVSSEEAPSASAGDSETQSELGAEDGTAGADTFAGASISPASTSER